MGRAAAKDGSVWTCQEVGYGRHDDGNDERGGDEDGNNLLSHDVAVPRDIGDGQWAVLAGISQCDLCHQPKILAIILLHATETVSVTKPRRTSRLVSPLTGVTS